jgi:hypothetical protein
MIIWIQNRNKIKIRYINIVEFSIHIGKRKENWLKNKVNIKGKYLRKKKF